MTKKRKPRRAVGASGAKTTGSGERSKDQSIASTAREQEEAAALNRARFAWLEVNRDDPHISARELRLAMFLHDFAGMTVTREHFRATGEIVVYPSQVTLAGRMHCTRQNVSATARKLAQRGLLLIKRGGGRGHATEYTLVTPPPEKGNPSSCSFPKQEKATARSIKSNYGHEKRATSSVAPITISRSQIINHTAGEGGYGINESEEVNAIKEEPCAEPNTRGENGSEDAAFEELCRIWPNREFDPGLAKGAWINNVIVAGIDPSVVLESARDFIDQWKRRGTGFFPYMGKWLAEKGWDTAEAAPLSGKHRSEMRSLEFLTEKSVRDACAQAGRYLPPPGFRALQERLREILSARSPAYIETLAVFLWALYETLSEVRDMLDRLIGEHVKVTEADIGAELCKIARPDPKRPIAEQIAAMVAKEQESWAARYKVRQ